MKGLSPAYRKMMKRSCHGSGQFTNEELSAGHRKMNAIRKRNEALVGNIDRVTRQPEESKGDYYDRKQKRIWGHGEDGTREDE